jgi:hypothetical protein
MQPRFLRLWILVLVSTAIATGVLIPAATAQHAPFPGIRLQ